MSTLVDRIPTRRAQRSSTLRPGAAGLAPGPAGGPRAVQNLRRFAADAPSYFLQLHRTYGDTVRLPLGFFTVHLPFAPADIRHVLQGANASFVRGKGYDFFKLFMGTGLLTTDGAEWKTRRRVVNPLFHHQMVEGMVGAMTAATTRVLDRWEREVHSDAGLDVVPESMHITLDALGAVMFDTDLEPTHARVGPAMDLAIRAMVFRGEPRQLLPAGLPFGYPRKVRRTQADLHSIVDGIVESHRSGSHVGRTDLVTLLLAGQEDGQGLSDDDVRDELVTIFMAGHETSGTGLAWTLAELARHPEVQERGRTEVDAVLGGAVPTLETLSRLTYVRQIVDETLRLHPPIWVFPRDAAEDVELGPYRVPAGESVFLCPYVTHRHPELWSAPHHFDPDRFAHGASASWPRFAYFPFGGGQRKCIGSEMALQQTYLTTAMVLQRFRLGARGHAPDPLGTLVSLRPLQGLHLDVRPR